MGSSDHSNFEQRQQVEEVTVLLHGIRSRGDGFDPLYQSLCQGDFPIETHRIKLYRYGSVSALSTLSSGVRNLLSDGIGFYIDRQTSLQKQFQDHEFIGVRPKYPNLETINVIAHSFGTFGLCKFIRDFSSSDVNLNTLILLNSVVDRNYPWSRFILDEMKVNKVWNIIGSVDFVPNFAPISGMGRSGTMWRIPLLDTYKQPGFLDTAKHNGDHNVQNIVMNGGHTHYETRQWVSQIRSILINECEHVAV